MSWFKKIFSSSPQETPQETVKKTVSEIILPKISSSLSYKDYFSGFDLEFINLMYFSNAEERQTFISSLEKLITKLKIDEKTDRVKSNLKLSSYFSESDDLSELEEGIQPLISNVVLYNNQMQTDTTIIDGEKKVIEKLVVVSKKENEGSNKLKHLFTAIALCKFNLERKVSNNFFDFNFEEDLINSTINNNDKKNFATIDILYCLGVSFYKANQIEKMEKYFNMIASVETDLSPTSLTPFYKSIAETFVELNQNEKALKWLKDGLALNPKLQVKRLIDGLEKKNIT